MDPKDIRIAELEAALTQIPCTSPDCQESNPCEVHIALTNWPIDPKCTSCVGTCIDQWVTNPFGDPTDCLACGATGKHSEQERRIRAVFNPANDAKTCAELRSEVEGKTIGGPTPPWIYSNTTSELCGEETPDGPCKSFKGHPENRGWIRVEVVGRTDNMAHVGVRVANGAFQAIGWVPLDKFIGDVK